MDCSNVCCLGRYYGIPDEFLHFLAVHCRASGNVCILSSVFVTIVAAFRSIPLPPPPPSLPPSGKVEKEKPEIVHPVPAKANGVLDHTQGYVEAVDANETTAEKQKSPPPGQ